MKRKILILIAGVVPILILDQITKFWIATRLSLIDSITIIENFIHIRHVRNTAGAFGSLSWLSMDLFIVLTIVSVVVIGFLYFRLNPKQQAAAAGLSLILGGALGNLIDRIRLGSVIDFIDVHYYSYHWPAFNVADSAITVGSLLLALCIIFGKW
ncbi:MAG TPA: signal peptidase II [Thermodesulfobacteriota bacterium]|nr:signal peptidase II [Deltaproteobacteria bacterium]HNU72491.1 signal peptidase II [Thermodesulfobacteriota bacterium]HQO77012.1 signal peptidase II [Thermodesulfobacteriota bacterium]